MLDLPKEEVREEAPKGRHRPGEGTGRVTAATA